MILFIYIAVVKVKMENFTPLTPYGARVFGPEGILGVFDTEKYLS